MSFDEALAQSLKSITEESRPKTIRATDEEVRTAATGMARAGYDFSRTPNSMKALRAYLEAKPLCLAGTTGTGKTMFFTALRDSGVAKNNIVVYSLNVHGNDFITDIVNEIKSYATCELVIDDVGTESNWNGHRTDDVLIRIIAVREQTQMPTHYTTNLSAVQLKERYDERVVSRLRQCQFVPMAGKDNRAVTPNTAKVQFRAECADPANWKLCEERCPQFINGKCADGESVPPMVKDETPESMCDVGKKIPYKNEYIVGQAELCAEMIKGHIRTGSDYEHLKEPARRRYNELAMRGLPTDCLKEFV